MRIGLTKLKLKECLKNKDNFIDGREFENKNILEKNKEIIRRILSLLSIDKDLKNFTGKEVYKISSISGDGVDKILKIMNEKVSEDLPDETIESWKP